MIGYVCKYTPVEVLESMGADMVRVDPSVTNFNLADTMMHPNVCSYAKSVLEDMQQKDYEGIILTTCCDSIRRLYDTLCAMYPDRFIYLLDIPHKVNDFSTGLYAKRILALAAAYADFSGREYDEEKLLDVIHRQQEAARLHGEPAGSGNSSRVRVGILGARCPRSLRSMLEEHGTETVFDMTCTGMDRGKSLWTRRIPEKAESPMEAYEAGKIPAVGRRKEKRTEKAAADGVSGAETAERTGAAGRPAGENRVNISRPLLRYADALLGQIPCLRMVNSVGRERYLEGFEGSIDGIIYHTVKFCDSYSYEYAKLHSKGISLPVLKLETDLTDQCAGQIRTRVEAFLESLQTRKTAGSRRPEESRAAAAGTGAGAKTMNKDNILVLGVDSGSTSTNAVLMNADREIVSFRIVRTGAKTSVSAEKILEEILRDASEKLGRQLKREDIRRVVSTGYGRVSIPYADQNITEISCHAKGARYFDPQVRTILDIGGQDSKAIRLDDEGNVADFVMNDKCAAGTGRFLEAMARTLEIDISELGPISLQSREKVEISSMCTVFAESEVISLIAQNKEKADIANGVHSAIAGKAVSLMKRVGLTPSYMMTGGVARNPGVVKAVEERIGAPLFICEQPDIVGAVGAALNALSSVQ